MKFIAHRGYSAKFAENTIPAFRATLENPHFKNDIIGIEIDIQLSSDEKLIVFHDTTIELNGKRIPVGKTDYKTLSLAIKNHSSYSDGTAIPDFSQTLDFIAHKTSLYVEIKKGEYDINILLDQVEELLKKYRPENDIVLHCFDVEIMNLCFKRFSSFKVKYGFLFDDADKVTDAGKSFVSKLDYLHPYAKTVIEKDDKLSKFGKPLNIWTINDMEQLKDVMSAKCNHMIQGIMTDDLALIDSWKKL